MYYIKNDKGHKNEKCGNAAICQIMAIGCSFSGPFAGVNGETWTRTVTRIYDVLPQDKWLDDISLKFQKKSAKHSRLWDHGSIYVM